MLLLQLAQGDLLGELPSKTISEEHVWIYSSSPFSRRNVDCYCTITTGKDKQQQTTKQTKINCSHVLFQKKERMWTHSFSVFPIISTEYLGRQLFEGCGHPQLFEVAWSLLHGSPKNCPATPVLTDQASIKPNFQNWRVVVKLKNYKDSQL